MIYFIYCNFSETSMGYQLNSQMNFENDYVASVEKYEFFFNHFVYNNNLQYLILI